VEGIGYMLLLGKYRGWHWNAQRGHRESISGTAIGMEMRPGWQLNYHLDNKQLLL